MKTLILFVFVALLSSCSSLIEHNGKTYKYISKPVSWDVAKTLAEEEGGRLAVFRTAEDLGTVEAKLPNGQISWVGLTDEAREGRWMWIDGTPLSREMLGRVQDGGNLDARDYAHILLQGGLGSRANSGALPRGWRGKPEVDGFLVEF